MGVFNGFLGVVELLGGFVLDRRMTRGEAMRSIL
jgi:hypothetical protein